MKKITSIIWVLVLCLSLCACDMPILSQNSSVEGRGYNSPEEAFLAYTEALKAGNVSKILSTFAIETYVENYDLEAYLDNVGSFSMAQGVMESNTPYAKEVNLITRQYQIIQQLRNLYAVIALGGDSINQPIVFNGTPYNDVDDFLDDYVMDDWMNILGEMQVDDDFQYLDDYLDGDALDRAEENLEMQCDFYGCSEIVPLALEIELDGEEYLMTINVARYDGKWYNLTPNGLISTLLGSSPNTAGLWFEK